MRARHKVSVPGRQKARGAAGRWIDPLFAKRVERLKTIPAVGPITALTWVLEIGERLEKELTDDESQERVGIRVQRLVREKMGIDRQQVTVVR